METITIKLTNLIADKQKYQFRPGLDLDHVAQLREAIRAGSEIEPMHTFYLNRQDFLVDGFHRRYAYQQEEVKQVTIIRHQGTPAEAMQYAATANLKHSYGLPLTTQAKMSILEVMYKPGEGGWENWSYSRLAAVLGLKSHNTAKSWVERLVQDGRLPESVLDRDRIIGKHGKMMDATAIGGPRLTSWGEPYADPNGDIQLPFTGPITEPYEKVRLQAKIKFLVYKGLLDSDQAEVHQFEELSVMSHDYRVKNIVTGEIIDAHTRPADKIAANNLAIRRAEVLVNSSAQQREDAEQLRQPEIANDTYQRMNVAYAKVRAASVQKPLVALLDIASIELCQHLPEADLHFLIANIDQSIERLQSFRAQLGVGQEYGQPA